MARITVEDSLKQIPNRFELTLIATYRARMLAQATHPRSKAATSPPSPPCAKWPPARSAAKCCAAVPT